MKKILIFIYILLLTSNAFATLTVNNVPRTKTGGSAPSLQDSQITDNGTGVGIGVTSPVQKLEVNGKTKTSNLQVTNIFGVSAQCLQVDGSGNVTGTGSACSTGSSSATTGEVLGQTWNRILQDPSLTVVGATFTEINSMAVYKGNLLLGYNVNSAGNLLSASKVYKWDGTTMTYLSTIGSGEHFQGVTFLQEYKGALYAGIQGSTAGDGDVYVSTNAGSTWALSNGGAGYFAYCAEVFNGNLYVGDGYITSAIRKYDGSSWSTPYAGLAGSGLVVSLKAFNGRIFAAFGGVTNAAILSSSDGSSWSSEYSVATSTYSEINHFVEFKGKLYANVIKGGSGTNAILVRDNSASTWSLAASLATGDQSWGMNVYNDVLYVGSSTNPNGAIIYKSYDGVTFTADPDWTQNTLGTGYEYEAFKMINYNGSLYVGMGGDGILSANMWRKTDSIGQVFDTANRFIKYMRFNNSNSYAFNNDYSAIGVSLPATFDSTMKVVGSMRGDQTIAVGVDDPRSLNANYLMGVYSSTNGNRAIFVSNPNVGTANQARFELLSSDSNGFIGQLPTNFFISAWQGRTILYNETGSGTIVAAATGDISFMTGATTTSMYVGSGGAVQIGSTAATAGPFIVTPPAAQTIAAGNTVTANACGSIKKITAAGGVTTDTTNTFTAPGATVNNCCMDVINVGANAITLDSNSNFVANGAADVVLGAGDTARVCEESATAKWYQIGATGNN